VEKVEKCENFGSTFSKGGNGNATDFGSTFSKGGKGGFSIQDYVF
jgi:hypothetical protein